MLNNKELVEVAFERWTNNEGSFLDLLADDVVWKTLGSGPFAITTSTKQEYVDRMVKPIAARFSQSLKPTVRGIWAEADTVIIHWDGAATARDDTPYHNTYAWFLRMESGKAIEVTAFFDLTRYEAVMTRVRPCEGKGD